MARKRVALTAAYAEANGVADRERVVGIEVGGERADFERPLFLSCRGQGTRDRRSGDEQQYAERHDGPLMGWMTAPIWRVKRKDGRVGGQETNAAVNGYCDGQKPNAAVNVDRPPHSQFDRPDRRYCLSIAGVGFEPTTPAL